MSRFGLVVSDKVAAGALPILGAVGGATVNVIFMDHFQRVAQAHFALRRLERTYGAATSASVMPSWPRGRRRPSADDVRLRTRRIRDTGCRRGRRS